MVSRRTILQGAVAATTLPIIAGVVWNSQSSPATAVEYARPPSLYKVLVDTRFAAARAFAHTAQWRGEPVYGFNGDITDVWYHDLYPRWQQGRAAIAGLTAYGALFCLEELAREVRMRVIQRREHRFPAHESLYSWVIA
jgi:hypothetical protein